jgi:DNA-binding transcriptional LysR family regulator
VSALHDGKCDLILGRLDNPPSRDSVADDLDVESLFEDEIVLAANKQSAWARRRKIDLAELSDAPWILPAKDTFNYACVVGAFRSRGLPMPKITLMAQSIPLRVYFLAHGEYIAAFPSSVLRSNADALGLKALPVELTVPRSLMAIITLKNRKLRPVAERFIERLRDVANSMRAGKANSQL